MTTITAPPAHFENLEEFVESLGGIPLWRIRFRPFPGMATEGDVIAALESPRKRICELIDGTLVEKPIGYPKSLLASFIIELLNAFVRPRNLGMVTAPDGTRELFPGLVRVPDVAFTSWDRCPGRRRPTGQIPALVPNLSIEILSPSNTAAEMSRKLRDYFSAGVERVWIVDPIPRTLSIYVDPDMHTMRHSSEIISGDPVLPGFTLDLAMLFGELDRHG